LRSNRRLRQHGTLKNPVVELQIGNQGNISIRLRKDLFGSVAQQLDTLYQKDKNVVSCTEALARMTLSRNTTRPINAITLRHIGIAEVVVLKSEGANENAASGTGGVQCCSRTNGARCSKVGLPSYLVKSG
jgi:hypothetical protein